MPNLRSIIDGPIPPTYTDASTGKQSSTVGRGAGMIRECLIFLAIASAAALTGCGGDDEEPAGLEHDVHVHLDEWSVETEPESIAGAGTVNIGGHNHGKYPHQVTVIKTDLDPGNLPISKSRVDVEAIGEPAVEFDVPAADGDEGTQVASAELTTGRYVVFCAIPGHYQQGMYGTLEVTAGPSPAASP